MAVLVEDTRQKPDQHTVKNESVSYTHLTLPTT